MLFIWKKKHIHVCKYIEYLWKATENIGNSASLWEREMGGWGSEWGERLTLHCKCSYQVWIVHHVSANSPGRAHLEGLAQVTCSWSSQTKAMPLYLQPQREVGPHGNIQMLLEKEDWMQEEQNPSSTWTSKSLTLTCQAQTQGRGKSAGEQFIFITFCY